MTIKVRIRKLAQGRLSYVLDIHCGGRRWSETLGIYHKADAPRNERQRAHRMAVEASTKRERELLTAQTADADTREKVWFAEYFEDVANRDWRYARKPRRVTESTKKSWRSALSKVVQWEVENKRRLRLTDIDVKWIEGFRQYLLTGVKQSTACTHFQKIGSCLDEAVKEGLIAINNARLVSPISMPNLPTGFLAAEQIAILAKTACDIPEVKRAFLFSCFTGLRPSDVRNLKWSNVRAIGSGYCLDFVPQKTKNRLYQLRIDLNNTAMSLLGITEVGFDLIAQAENYVFNLPSEKTVNKYIQKWCTNAGINENVTYRTSRHSFATEIYDKTNDPYVARDLLGHASVTTTERYAKALSQKSRDAIKKMSIVEIDLSEFEGVQNDD